MGIPDFTELERCRMSGDELMVALRKSGTTDVSEVAYAILEQDGTVSVIPRAYAKPATAKDVLAKNSESGIFHIIIDRGLINSDSLKKINKSAEWVENAVKKYEIRISSVRLMLCDEIGNILLYTSSGKKEPK